MLLFIVDILNEQATLLVPNDFVKQVAEKKLQRHRVGRQRRAARDHVAQEADHPGIGHLKGRPMTQIINSAGRDRGRLRRAVLRPWGRSADNGVAPYPEAVAALQDLQGGAWS